MISNGGRNEENIPRATAKQAAWKSKQGIGETDTDESGAQQGVK